jgi:DNA-binding response OmpR family regulator
MAVVHGIVKNHDGMISVDSKPGVGTEVSIYLPRIYLESVQPERRLKEEPTEGTEMILMVDDEPDILTIGEQLLKHMGYTVTTCDDPEKALDLAIDRSVHFDLVITDLTMPKVSGEDLAKYIRKNRPELPVIMFTGYTETISDDQAREMGVSRVLIKPFTMEELGRSVRQVLDRAKRSTGDQML